MKNYFLVFVILLLPIFLFAQASTKDKRLKLTVSNGVSVTNYWNKGYHNTALFFSCPCFTKTFKKSKPAYFFDANLTYPIGKRQHLGLGISNYRMRYLIEFDYSDGGFVETGIVQNDITNSFTSYYLIHLWTIKQNKETLLHWNNSLGLDHQNFISNINHINPFYRTGLLLEQRVWKKVIFTFQPFVQTALKSYTEERFQADNRLTPITIGGSVGLKLHLMEFY